MNANGSDPLNRTGSPAAERLDDWSPDSTRLVFSSDRSGNLDLYLAGAEGGEAARITTSAAADTNAAWSPDGRTIAFSSDRDGDRDVFVVASDGTRERQLTRNAAEDVVLDWQPLQDTQAPAATALPGTGVRGRALRLRYRVVDDSGRAAVRFSLGFGSTSVGFLSFGRGATPLPPARAGRTYSVTLPAELVRGLPGQFRFCVMATDPSGNEGRQSCAVIRLRGPAPPRA